MTSLDHKLHQIQDFLVSNPNTSVRVKFNFTDKYRQFPSDDVTRDTFWDTSEKGVPLDNLDVIERDTNETVLGQLSFIEWLKINALIAPRDTRETLFGQGVPDPDPTTAEPQTRTPLGVRLDAGDAPTVDWADLGERDFEKALQTITSVDELNGLANRRRVLRHDFKKWNEAQIGLILNRKFILENKNG